jgi:hypothetical protein
LTPPAHRLAIEPRKPEPSCSGFAFWALGGGHFASRFCAWRPFTATRTTVAITQILKPSSSYKSGVQLHLECQHFSYMQNAYDMSTTIKFLAQKPHAKPCRTCFFSFFWDMIAAHHRQQQCPTRVTADLLLNVNFVTLPRSDLSVAPLCATHITRPEIRMRSLVFTPSKRTRFAVQAAS